MLTYEQILDAFERGTRLQIVAREDGRGPGGVDSLIGHIGYISYLEQAKLKDRAKHPGPEWNKFSVRICFDDPGRGEWWCEIECLRPIAPSFSEAIKNAKTDFIA